MIRIGIISPSEIAFRRFLPSLQKMEEFEFAGVAIADNSEWNKVSGEIIKEETLKAEKFILNYGGQLYRSYQSLIDDDNIDAIYIPLPPALHYQWAKKSLCKNKHILLEKPATTKYIHTHELVRIATERKLALHENYMFLFHNQIHDIDMIINQNQLGECRQFSIQFGFPRRDSNDFRYNRELGGGALLDAGGYTLKYAAHLLGTTARLSNAHSLYYNDFDVDIIGSGTMINNMGITAQFSFGMDNGYKCDLDIWGSKGNLHTGRVLTAPPLFTPTARVKIENVEKEIQLSEDDSFKKSLEFFNICINDIVTRKKSYNSIVNQAKLLEEFVSLSKNHLYER